MKVVLVSSFFHPSVGGVERQVEEIAYHLLQNGLEVQVLTTDATHGVEKRMQRLGENLRGIPVKRFRYIVAFGDFFRFAPGILWRLWVDDYQIVHIHNAHDAHLLGAILIKMFRRKKLVLTGHNPYVVNKEKRGDNLSKGVRLFEGVFRLFAGRVDHYIALLKSEQAEVSRRFGWGEKKITVIPNGIQDIFYAESGEADNFYRTWHIQPEKWQLIVGSVGRINYVKGLQNLEDAVDNLKRVLFIFAGGDSGYLSTLRKIFNNHPNVLFTNQYLPSDEVRDFYQAIDIFLLPSVYEPFGMTLVEAMAQGKPILSSNVGGPAGIVKPEFGELISPKEQNVWRERIKYYSQHREELPVMGDNAKQAAEAYRWRVVISQLIEVYTVLVTPK